MKIRTLHLLLPLLCLPWFMQAQELSVIKGFTAPSAISYYNNELYISCLGAGENTGYISIVDDYMTNPPRKLVENLRAPRGMAFHKGLLYVCDLNRVVAFNLNNGIQVAAYDFSSTGTKHLSSIVVLDDHTFLVAGKDVNTIFKLNIKNGKYTPFIILSTPVNLQLDELKQKLFVTCAGDNMQASGKLGVVNLKSKEPFFTTLSDYVGFIGGSAIYSNTIYFSDWKSNNKSTGEILSMDMSSKDVKTLSAGLRLNKPGAIFYNYRLHTFYVAGEDSNAIYKISIND